MNRAPPEIRHDPVPHIKCEHIRPARRLIIEAEIQL